MSTFTSEKASQNLLNLNCREEHFAKYMHYIAFSYFYLIFILG